MNVRILPMDKIEHGNKSIKNLQIDFFLKDLPSRYDNDGLAKYCYKKKGIVATEGTPILFQYKNQIIAMAIFDKIKKFEKEQDSYFGAYYFKPKTIQVFEQISESEICKIFNKEIKFSQIKHTLNKNYLPKFISNLKNKRSIDTNIIKTNKWSCCNTK